MGNTQNSNKNKMFFHYTTGNKISSILNDGLLRRSEILLFPNEKPVLWFSSNQDWENTTRKSIGFVSEQGQYTKYLLDKKEQHKKLTLVRFGLSFKDHRVNDWNTTCKKAKTPLMMKYGLEHTGIEMGGNPRQWYGVLCDLSVEELTFQVWDGNEWVDKDISNWFLTEYKEDPNCIGTRTPTWEQDFGIVI